VVVVGVVDVEGGFWNMFGVKKNSVTVAMLIINAKTQIIAIAVT